MIQARRIIIGRFHFQQAPQISEDVEFPAIPQIVSADL